MGTWPMPSNRAGTWDPDSQSSAETQSPCVHLCHSRTLFTPNQITWLRPYKLQTMSGAASRK